MNESALVSVTRLYRVTCHVVPAASPRDLSHIQWEEALVERIHTLNCLSGRTIHDNSC